MKKIIKIFAAMAAAFMVTTSLERSAKAVWPSRDCPLISKEEYDAACRANSAIATCCFYNPDEIFQLGDVNYRSLAVPSDTITDPNRAFVAICLKNEKAREIFIEYFKSKFGELINLIDPRENLFIISFADLKELNGKIAIYNECASFETSSIDEEWCIEEVLAASHLRSGVKEGFIRISPFFRAKARVIASFVRNFKPGDTFRVRRATPEEEINRNVFDRWSDMDELFDIRSGNWVDTQTRPVKRPRPDTQIARLNKRRRLVPDSV